MESIQHTLKTPIQHLEAFKMPEMTRIPKCIWIMIFCQLDRAHDLGQVSQTCKHWHVIASEKIIWKSLIPKLWPHLSSFEFEQPRAFVSTQFRLTPLLFVKEKSFEDPKFSLNTHSISIAPKPYLFGKEVFFLKEKEASTLCYTLDYNEQGCSFIIKKYSEDENAKQNRCNSLDLSFIISGKDEVSVKEIRIVGETVIFHVNYTVYFVPFVDYSLRMQEKDDKGSSLIFINKSALSLIGHIDSSKEKICDYELSENGALRIFKSEFTSPEVYNPQKRKRGFCTIF